MPYIETPWPEDFVKRLNENQNNGRYHPYTCSGCRDKLGIYYARNKQTGEERHIGILGKCNEDEDPVIYDRKLIATKDGWICPTCDYKQNNATT